MFSGPNTKTKAKLRKANLKKVRCPQCGSRILDEREDTDTEVRMMEPEDPCPALYYTKCWKCKASLGLIKIE